MTIVTKPQWWLNFSSFYAFPNDAGATIDSDVLITTLKDYVEGGFSQITSSAFQSLFTYIVQQSSSKINETGEIISDTANGELYLGYGGYDFLAGNAGDNVLHGGRGNDFFSPGGGIDIVIGSDDTATIPEFDTVGYLTAQNGVVIEATIDTSGGGASGYEPNQDIYSFTYEDWVEPGVPKISGFEVGAGGDFVDVSAMLASVGYTGTDPVGDRYIRFGTVSNGIKIQFDPDGNGPTGGGEFVRLLGLTIADFSVEHNLMITPLPPVTGAPNYITYVSDDGAGAYDILYSVENFIGSKFDDVIHGHTVLSNIIAGGSGSDSLYGEGGGNILVGGTGLDYLYGGDGIDLLIIGEGNDQVYGGDGADTFKFDGTIGFDIAVNAADIFDFQVGANGDKIDVSEILDGIGYTGSNALADGYVQIIQSGLDTNIRIDVDGTAGVQAAQTLAVLHNVDAAQVSTADNLVISAPKLLYVSALGQSNAEGLRVYGGDADSALTRIRDGVLAQTDYDGVRIEFKDESGSAYVPAIGSTMVNGSAGGKNSDSWWFPATNTPGEILIRAVEMLTVQIAELRATGSVNPVVIWGQGEGDSAYIGGKSTEAARLAAQETYKNATLAVFDYIKAQVGDDIQFYIMETGRYNETAAHNAGISPGTINNVQTGLPYIREAQEQLALDRPEVFIATKYTDLPMNSEYDPIGAPNDTWHFHPETREIIGDRLADFISLNMGYDLVLDNPGDYPIHMLTDVTLQSSAGLTVNGNANDNIVVGTLGNDTLTGGAGNDTLYGGAGHDLVLYTGAYADYSLAMNTWLTVTDLVGVDGTDILMDIEEIVFADGVYQNGAFVPTGANTAPVAIDDGFAGDQDAIITGNVLSDNGNGADSDADGDALTVVAGTYASVHGSVIVNADGSFTYTPDAGYFGADSFEYTLSDGNGGSDIGSVALTINEVIVPPVNTAPVAIDDGFAGDQDAIITGNVLSDNGNGADSDADGDALTVVAGTYASVHGSVIVNADGSFTYTPDAGYFGADSFEYTLSDGNGGSDIGSVALTINEVVPVNNDDIFIGTVTFETFDGGIGSDTVDYSASSAVRVDLANHSASGGFAAGDTLISIENVIGSNSASSADRDYIWGDANDNSIYGMNGADILEGGGGADIIDGGAGWDYSRYTRSSAGVNINMQTNVNTGGDAEGDILIGIEAVVGSQYDDTIYGADTDDYLKGENGNDTLSGGLGRDIIYGGSGNDTYVYVGGRDLLIEEGTGVERVVFDAMWSPEMVNVTGNKMFLYGNGNEIEFNDISMFEHFSFNGFSDMTLQEVIDYVPPVVGGDDNVFIGTSAVETFDGGGGNDTVDYSASVAEIKVDLQNYTATNGNAQGDILISIENVIGSNNSSVRDWIYGDVFDNEIYGMSGDDILEGGAGADIIDGGLGWDYSRYTRSDAGININLETGVNTGGHAQGDVLIGIEAVVGSKYDDVIHGGNFDDYLKGENGNDIISGGLGIDQLFGGNGVDTFLFEAASAFAGADKVRDFSLAQGDKLDISDLLTGYDPLSSAITDFVQITESGSNSTLAVDADGGGDNYIAVAIIQGVLGLTDEQALLDTGHLIV